MTYINIYIYIYIYIIRGGRQWGKEKLKGGVNEPKFLPSLSYLYLSLSLQPEKVLLIFKKVPIYISGESFEEWAYGETIICNGIKHLCIVNLIVNKDVIFGGSHTHIREVQFSERQSFAMKIIISWEIMLPLNVF